MPISMKGTADVPDGGQAVIDGGKHRSAKHRFDSRLTVRVVTERTLSALRYPKAARHATANMARR